MWLAGSLSKLTMKYWAFICWMGWYSAAMTGRSCACNALHSEIQSQSGVNSKKAQLAKFPETLATAYEQRSHAS
jgi:hypothetical protein